MNCNPTVVAFADVLATDGRSDGRLVVVAAIEYDKYCVEFESCLRLYICQAHE